MFPRLGFGLGLRRPHYQKVLTQRPAVDWFELISENYMPVTAGWGDPVLHLLDTLREQYPMVLHGVSLSLGSCDPLNQVYLGHLKQLIDRLEPAIVSDHLCWSGVDGKYVHDLLPLPYTPAVADWVAEKIQRVQAFLGRRILVENVSSYLTYAWSEMTEWEFLTEVVSKADCGILLDVNNVYVSAINHGFDPLDYLNGLPVNRIGQIHLAGHLRQGEFLIDTHAQPICEDVWQLYRSALQRFGFVSTNIERDDHIPELEELLAELRHAQAIGQEVSDACAPSIA